MLVNEKIFREYDIRGVVDTGNGKGDFDAGLAQMLGRAFAELVCADNPQCAPRDLTVAAGRDCRLSGEALHSALVKGLLEGGVRVMDCGMGPTPQLYFATVTQHAHGGIQVTGSHNPSDQNGFKMMIGSTTLSGDYIQRLKQGVFAAAKTQPKSQAETSRISEFDARTAYIAELVSRSQPHMGKRPLKIVVDGGNGVGGMVAPEVLRRLGCEVIELFCEPDGRFPNHHPDPTVLENIEELCKQVVAQRADLGIAWDGDADRIGVVDEHGQVIFGDMLLMIYGRQLLKEVEKPIIIADVKCSQLFFDVLREEGAETVMAKTGHSLIKAKIKELHAHLAGEMSGHIFFVHRYFGFDDAMHASARLVEILSNTEIAMSQLLSDLPKMVSTPELRLDCPDEIKFKVVAEAQKKFPEYEVNTLDGARIKFPHGWGLVRASNTQACLVMRFEADNAEHLQQYQSLFEGRIAEIVKALS